MIGQGVWILWGVENCHLPLTKPVAVNTGLALPRSPWYSSLPARRPSPHHHTNRLPNQRTTEVYETSQCLGNVHFHSSAADKWACMRLGTVSVVRLFSVLQLLSGGCISELLPCDAWPTVTFPAAELVIGVASYGALGHVPPPAPRLPAIYFFLLHFWAIQSTKAYEYRDY